MSTATYARDLRTISAIHVFTADKRTPPGELAEIRVTCNAVFRGSRLVIDPSCAESFVVHLDVGPVRYFYDWETNQGISGTLLPPLPLCIAPDMLAKHAALLSVDILTAQEGTRLVLYGRNTSNKPARLAGALWGVGIAP